MNSISNSRLRENWQAYRPPIALQYLFLLYIFLKPFYIFESGSFQPSDAVFILSFFVFLYHSRSTSLIRCGFDYILCIFVFFTFVVNLFYFLLYRQSEFITSSLHYVFNLLVVLVARVLLLDKEFLRKLFWVCRICLYLQVILFFLGIGKFYVDANGITGRYLGTFNDPNQLAFYMFALLLIMFMIGKFPDSNCRIRMPDYAVFLFILYHTASISMLIAFAVFVVSNLVVSVASLAAERDYKRRKRVLSGLVAAVAVVVVFCVFYNPIIEFVENSQMFSRLLAKENLAVTITDSEYTDPSIWQDRNIDKLYLYPQYTIFGAGQGYFMRFYRSNSSGEIHSTVLSILFCYGIIPTSLFLLWVWKNIKKGACFIPVFLALAVESLVLLNQRQPLFWLIFLLSYSYRIMEEKRYEDAFYTR